MQHLASPAVARPSCQTLGVMNRTRIALALSALLLVAAGSSGATEGRPEIEGVTAVVVTPVSGGSSTRVEEPEGVAVFMREINAERHKLWKPFQGRLSACAVRFSFFARDQRVARIVFDDSRLIELAGASEATGFAREVGRSEANRVRRLAAYVQNSKACAK